MMLWEYFNFQRRWMLVLYILLSVSVILFVVQAPISTHRLLQVVGLTEDQTVGPFKRSFRCEPVKNIVFLKTHKTAGSSVQNIFMRYANSRKLVVAVPANKKTSIFSSLRPFRKEMATGVPWESLGFNILCHHMVFNGRAIQSIMPQDSIFISIVREPVSLFESLYEYSELGHHYNMDIEEYAIATKNMSLWNKLKKRGSGMGRNQMLYDFGMHPNDFDNPTKVKSMIESLDNYFAFVMVTEYFDESLVILRHILCWELDDVISLTLNARMDNYRRNLSDEAVKNLKEWNWGDEMLYEHYLKKFKDTVEDLGKEEIENEVQQLRKRRGEWQNYCVEEKVGAKNLTAFRIWSRKVSGYKLKPYIKNETCEDLVKPENYFTSEIRQKQLLRSIMNGVKLPTHGPRSFTNLLDIKFLKGHDQEVARKLLENQYKYNRRRFTILKEKRKN